MESSDRPFSRRGFIRAGAGTATGLAALNAAGSASAQSDLYGGHLADTSNFTGTTSDAREVEEIVVEVGVEGNDGPNAFGPPAILVEPGTTVTFQWTGNGFHNVIHQPNTDPDRSEELFNSNDEFGSAVESPGSPWEFTFEEAGLYPYYCGPHQSLGMQGIVVVGEDNVEGDLVVFGEEEEPFSIPGSVWTGIAVFGGVSVVGVAAYRELIYGYDEDTHGGDDHGGDAHAEDDHSEDDHGGDDHVDDTADAEESE